MAQIPPQPTPEHIWDPWERQWLPPNAIRYSQVLNSNGYDPDNYAPGMRDNAPPPTPSITHGSSRGGTAGSTYTPAAPSGAGGSGGGSSENDNISEFGLSVPSAGAPSGGQGSYAVDPATGNIIPAGPALQDHIRSGGSTIDIPINLYTGQNLGGGGAGLGNMSDDDLVDLINTTIGDQFAGIEDIFDTGFDDLIQALMPAETPNELPPGLADIDLFQPDVYPTTESESESESSGTSSSQSSSQNQAASLSQQSGASSAFNQSFSGLNEADRSQLMGAVLPMLVQQVGNLPKNIDDYVTNAANMYEGQARTLMGDAMQGLMNNLAGRNMLNSSVAGDAISKTMAQIFPTFADKTFQAGMEGANMRLQMPQILGNLAQLGQFSTGLGGSQSTNQGQSASGSLGTSASTSQSANQSRSAAGSQTANPLAPFELVADFLLNY